MEAERGDGEVAAGSPGTITADPGGVDGGVGRQFTEFFGADAESSPDGRDGRIEVPNLPGIGVIFDEAALASFDRSRQGWRSFAVT